jgi:hypothetical protein
VRSLKVNLGEIKRFGCEQLK